MNNYILPISIIGALSLLAISANAKPIARNRKINLFKGKTWDSRTDKKIEGLHPIIQNSVQAAINELDKKEGIKVRVYSGFRSNEEQNALYQKGRNTFGSIVTNAKGGQSYHNYGLAVDVVEISKGKAIWNREAYYPIARVFKKYGFEWGGDFNTFKDYPHFQMTFGKRTRELKNMVPINEKFPNLKL